MVFDAAYGGERMRAHLFLPKNGFAAVPDRRLLSGRGRIPPAIEPRHVARAGSSFIIRSGRAFLYPVYKGTYERPAPDASGVNAERELAHRLVARPRARHRLSGNAIGHRSARARLLRRERRRRGRRVLDRDRTAAEDSVLQGPDRLDDAPPEIDAANYAPRIRIPTLMLNGRYDFEPPFETAQRPLFELLGAPAEHKRHKVFDTGHALPMDDVAGEISPGSIDTRDSDIPLIQKSRGPGFTQGHEGHNGHNVNRIDF